MLRGTIALLRRTSEELRRAGGMLGWTDGVQQPCNSPGSQQLLWGAEIPLGRLRNSQFGSGNRVGGVKRSNAACRMSSLELLLPQLIPQARRKV